MGLSENEKQSILRDIWNGIITLRTLPLNLYNDISGNLKKGLFRGFGKNLSRLNIESSDFKTLTALNNNIHFFSAAKVFQQTNDIRNFLFDQEGFKRPFNAFAIDANKIYERYNVDWQRTEFDTTISQAQASSQWQEIQDDKDDLPLLQYQTADDEKVRPEHAAWDNIVKPVNDPFWDSHMPPNGFNCRCIVIQLEEGEKKETNLPEHLKKVKKKFPTVKSLDNKELLFRPNPGVSNKIFTEKGKGQHPYFNVSSQFKDLKDNHFNLPRP